MNWELVFKIANFSVLPAWFLLVFLPKHRITKVLAHGYLYPILLGAFYLYMLLRHLEETEEWTR